MENYQTLFFNQETSTDSSDSASLEENSQKNSFSYTQKSGIATYSALRTDEKTSVSNYQDYTKVYESQNSFIDSFSNRFSEYSESSSNDYSVSSDETEGKENNCSYSESFNSILTALSTLAKSTQEYGLKASLRSSILLWERLDALGDSFVTTAVNYGRIIIKERKQASFDKTILPTSLRGVAGGDKYIAQGILFKFPEDKEIGNNQWLYGGDTRNDFLAAKSAGQELLSANFVGSYSPLIKVPLMAVIDYWGYRLIATALLPIKESDSSLIYGYAEMLGKLFF